MTSRLGTISSANQTVLDELSDSAKAKVPHDVHAQLTTEFVPGFVFPRLSFIFLIEMPILQF